ncbi:nucleotidyltransferase family protein [Pseudozobellia thermophila]|uniref:Nucleotidyl transferase n=1 Tax=Pseudozobellia thermophila TaxID=192903 RepID=A0A1M6MYA7_9FLAO|nr:sugar phosphate nucleotidyltransferase [Pseudozobellia thermophila]SHJ88429.1 Nucleotidyl transferase [Pseudozobellia thermophila]
MILLLMAAGSGSRYGKLKQFDDLGPNGEFLMEFGISDALKNGFDHIVLITKKDNVAFLDDHLRSRLPSNIKLDVLAQEITDLPDGCTFEGERTKPWGTAHAVWTARKVIDGPFAVINADDFYGQPAYENAANFMRAHQADNTYALVGYTLKDTLSEHGSVSRGVCKVDGDNLVSVDERLKLVQEEGKVIDLDSGNEYTGNESVSMNFWICKPSIFDKIENDFRTFLDCKDLDAKSELYIPKIIQDMLQAGEIKVKVVPSGGDWFGVTYASDRDAAVAYLKEKTEAGKYTSPLWPNE